MLRGASRPSERDDLPPELLARDVAVCIPNLGYESDITGHLRYPVDIIQEKLDHSGGSLRPPQGPGLGVTLAEDVLARWRLDR